MIGAVSAASDTSTEDIVNQDISIENNQNNHNDHENDVKVMEKTKKTTENNNINTNTNTNNLKKTEETQNTNTNNTNHQTTNTNNKLKTNNNNENLLKETQTTATNWNELKNKAKSPGEISIKLNGDEYTATDTIYIDSGRKVTIEGNGKTINGQKQYQIFTVNGELILKNLKLINGKSDTVGGAIYNNGKLTIINCTFTNNTANIYGGAIYAEQYSTVNINNTTFTQNTATIYGGAIHAHQYSTVNINNTNFTQNTANNGDGGAIYAHQYSTVNINNTQFKQNTAYSGGAIYAHQYSTVNINNTQFKQNTANYDGGAIYAYDYSTVNINNTTFTQNNANYGGAIYNYGTVIIMGSELTDNTATYDGGAIYNLAGTLTLVDSKLQNDGLYIYSSVGEGVVHIGGYIAFVTTRVFDISVLPAVDVDLVEIQLRGYSGEVWVNVTNSTFNQIVKVNLKNGEGSGTINLPIGNKYNATINTIQGTSINPQTQEFTTIHETSFTALYNNITKSQNGQLTLTHNYTYDDRTDKDDLITGIPINKTITINGNGYTIDGSNEARIFNVTNGAQLRLINITLTKGKGQNTYIEEWYGDYYVGGAIYATDNCNVTITDSKITHNNATYTGGAIFAWNSQVNINNTNITQNNANRGGAIFAYDNSQININNTNITQNNVNGAYGYGGAIYTSNSQINITHTNINHNNATYCGGAIYADDNSQINITHTNINHNNANNGDGGAISAGNSQINISYTSFIKNTAKETDLNYGGGAIFAGYDSIMVVSSSLFMDNTASKNGGAIYGDSFKNLTVNHNIFLNNGNKEIYLDKDDIVVFDYDFDCNWFGNTNDNYTTNPSVAGMELDNWLFLNATSNPDPVTVLSASNITFKLFLYNKTDQKTYDYDNSQLKQVNLTVSNEKGHIDKSIVVLGEAIPYNTPSTVDSDSISANIGNIITYTFNFDIKQKEVNTIIKDLKVDSTLYKDKPSLIEGYLYNTTGLGNQNITLKITYSSGNPEIYHLTTDKNGKFNKTITPTLLGQVKIEAIYNGNTTNQYKYNATNTTTTSNIIPITYNITFDKLQPSYDYNTTVTITGTVTTNYQTLDVASVNITLNNGNKDVVNLINGKFTYKFNGTIGGLNNITVICKDDTNTTQAFIKYHTTFTITVSNSTTDKPILVTVTEANKFTGTINITINNTDYTVTLNEGIGTSNPITLTKGTYTAMIDYKGNETYNATTTTSKPFTIKYPTQFIIQNIPDITEGSNIDLIVNEENKYTGPVIIIIGSETYTVNMANGNGKLSINPKLNPGTYTAKIDFKGNENYTNATATSNQFKINNKPTPTPEPTPSGKIATKIIAKQKTFKLETKNKKYTITLKDSTGKIIKKAKVTLKVKGKTYKATTNNKGKATFKITNINKKGKYTATINYKGNKKYKATTKKIRLTVKTTFKTIGKNSKNKKMIKKIQKALKKNGYYTYEGKRYLKIDGIYHKWTQKAVKQYQKAKKLPVTGAVDQKTAKKLKII